MAYFVWGDDLVIDHGPLDDDHRQLVDCVNQLHTATSEGRGHAVVRHILEQLLAYTQAHFDREEREMALYHFPQLVRHKEQHVKLLNAVMELKRKFDAGGLTVASQVSVLLRDWLSIHIRREDKELARHVKLMKKRG